MALSLRGDNSHEFLDSGWGVVGEELELPYMEKLVAVYPLEQRAQAGADARERQELAESGLSWLLRPVQLCAVEEIDGGRVADYIEVSDLVMSGIRRASNRG